MIRTAYVDISVTAHATFSDRLEIPQNADFFFFFLLRGSPAWATHQEKRQAVQTQQIQTQEEVSLMSIFLCSHTRTHAHHRR